MTAIQLHGKTLQCPTCGSEDLEVIAGPEYPAVPTAEIQCCECRLFWTRPVRNPRPGKPAVADAGR